MPLCKVLYPKEKNYLLSIDVIYVTIRKVTFGG